MSARERLVLIPLVVFVFWIGIYPAPFLNRIEPAVKQVLSQVGRATTVQSDEVLNTQHLTLDEAETEEEKLARLEGEIE